MRPPSGVMILGISNIIYALALSVISMSIYHRLIHLEELAEVVEKESAVMARTVSALSKEANDLKQRFKLLDADDKLKLKTLLKSLKEVKIDLKDMEWKRLP